MGSSAFVIALVLSSGLIALLATPRWSSGLRIRLARITGYESTNSETTPSRAKDNIADAQPRRTSAFQLRVQVAQHPFKSTTPW
jgi:hypothetical protein